MSSDDVLEAKYYVLSAQIQQVEVKLSTETRKTKALEEQLKQANNTHRVEFAQCNEVLATTSQRAKDAENQVFELTEKVADLETSLSARVSERNLLEQQLQRLKDSHSASDLAYRAKQEEKDREVQEARALLERFVSLKAELASSQHAHSEEVRRLASKHAQEMNAIQTQLREAESGWTAKQANLQQQMLEAEEMHATEKDKLKQQLANMRTELAAVYNAQTSATGSQTVQAAKIKELQAQVVSYKEQLAMNGSGRSWAVELRSANEKYLKEMERSKEKDAALKLLTDQVTVLKETLSEKTAELASPAQPYMCNSCVNNAVSGDTVERWKHEAERRAEQLQELDERMKAELTAREQDIQRLQETARCVSSVNKRLLAQTEGPPQSRRKVLDSASQTEQVDTPAPSPSSPPPTLAVDSEVSALRGRISFYEEQVRQLQKTERNTETELLQIRIKLKSMEVENSTSQRLLKAAEDANKRKDSALASLTDENLRLKSTLDTEKETRAALNKQLRSAREGPDPLKERTQHAEATSKQLRKLVQQRNDELTVLQQAYDDSRSEVTSYARHLQQLVTEVRDLEEEVRLRATEVADGKSVNDSVGASRQKLLHEAEKRCREAESAQQTLAREVERLTREAEERSMALETASEDARRAKEAAGIAQILEERLKARVEEAEAQVQNEAVKREKLQSAKRELKNMSKALASELSANSASMACMRQQLESTLKELSEAHTSAAQATAALYEAQELLTSLRERYQSVQMSHASITVARDDAVADKLRLLDLISELEEQNSVLTFRNNNSQPGEGGSRPCMHCAEANAESLKWRHKYENMRAEWDNLNELTNSQRNQLEASNAKNDKLISEASNQFASEAARLTFQASSQAARITQLQASLSAHASTIDTERAARDKAQTELSETKRQYEEDMDASQRAIDDEMDARLLAEATVKVLRGQIEELQQKVKDEASRHKHSSQLMTLLENQLMVAHGSVEVSEAEIKRLAEELDNTKVALSNCERQLKLQAERHVARATRVDLIHQGLAQRLSELRVAKETTNRSAQVNSKLQGELQTENRLLRSSMQTFRTQIESLVKASSHTLTPESLATALRPCVDALPNRANTNDDPQEVVADLQAQLQAIALDAKRNENLCLSADEIRRHFDEHPVFVVPEQDWIIRSEQLVTTALQAETQLRLCEQKLLELTRQHDNELRIEKEKAAAFETMVFMKDKEVEKLTLALRNSEDVRGDNSQKLAAALHEVGKLSRIAGEPVQPGTTPTVTTSSVTVKDASMIGRLVDTKQCEELERMLEEEIKARVALQRAVLVLQESSLLELLGTTGACLESVQTSLGEVLISTDAIALKGSPTIALVREALVKLKLQSDVLDSVRRGVESSLDVPIRQRRRQNTRLTLEDEAEQLAVDLDFQNLRLHQEQTEKLQVVNRLQETCVQLQASEESRLLLEMELAEARSTSTFRKARHFEAHGRESTK